MKINELTVDDIQTYLKIDLETDEETALMSDVFMPAALNYIKERTGLSDESVNEYDDLAHAYLLLIADMYDNRNLQMDKKTTTNRAVDLILGMRTENYL